MTQEQKERNLRLAKALESNQYKQGKGLLRCGDYFCCLGVACDLFSKETGLGTWDDDTFVVGEESGRMVAPEVVSRWYGWEHCDPQLLGERHPAYGSKYAACLNDRGASFSEIAAGFRNKVVDADPAIPV